MRAGLFGVRAEVMYILPDGRGDAQAGGYSALTSLSLSLSLATGLWIPACKPSLSCCKLRLWVRDSLLTR